MPFVMNKSMIPDREFVLLDRWLEHPPLSRAVGVTIAIVLSVVMVIGALGNTLVIVVYAKYKSLQTSPNTFVINLTVADLSMCLLCFPILIANSFLGSMDGEFVYFFCNFDAFIGALTGFVSIFSLTALSLDRCIVINRKFPMMYPDDRWTVYLAICLIWLFCAAFSAMPIFGFGKYVMEGSRLSCTFDYFTHSDLNLAYNIVIQLVFFAFPVVTIAVCYTCIYIKVRSHEQTYFRKRNSKDFDEVVLRRIRKSRKFEKNELKTARAAVIVIGVFCITWLPYSIISWVGLFGDSSNLTPIIVAIPAVLAKTSTVINPILYAYTNKRLQRKVLLLFKNMCFKRNRGAVDLLPQSNSYACSLFIKKGSNYPTVAGATTGV